MVVRLCGAAVEIPPFVCEFSNVAGESPVADIVRWAV